MPANGSEQPENKRLSVEERAQLYLDKIEGAVKGQNGHAAGFHAACVLVQGFDLPQSTALAMMAGYNARCSPPFSEKQLRRKVTCAAAASGLMTKDGLKPRGCLRDAGGEGGDYVGRPIPTKSKEEIEAEAAALAAREMGKAQFDAAELARMAAPWRDKVDLVWFANRSAKDPAQVTSNGFLQALYAPGENVLCFNVVNKKGQPWTQGEAVWPKDKLPAGGSDGVWFLAQPVDGRSYPNPRADRDDGKIPLSRRSQESVTAFRYMVLESDKADMRDWLGLLVQLPLRIDAIYTSGGRSIHALVRVDCPTKGAWDDEKRALEPTLRLLGIGGMDAQVLSAVRLTRLPGAMRIGKRDKDLNYKPYPSPQLQKLIYLNPGAPLRALKDAPVARDVEQYWCGLADMGVGDADEGDGVAWIKQGLAYYRNVSARIRTSEAAFLQQLEVAA